jgi:6-phosphogluconolactonase (cycloisomerase 2 family)
VQNSRWVFRSWLSLGALLWALGCGGHTTKQNYLYVGQVIPPNSDPTLLWSGSIAQFRLGNDGTLRAVNLPGPNPFTPFYLAVAPSNQYLFASDLVQVNEFQIGSDGALTGETPVDLPAGSVVFTPNGHFALMVDAANRTLTSYGLSSSGAPTQINVVETSSSSSYGDSSTQAIVDPSGKFVYVNDEYDNTILGYTISPAGTLAPFGSFPAGGVTPFQLVFSPNGLLYSANGNPATVTTSSLNSTNGSLTLVGEPVAYQPSGLFWLTFDPSGRYAYVGSCGEIEQFSVSPSGALIANGVVPTPQCVRTGLVDPSGRFLFASFNDGTISQYIIGSNGALLPNGSVSLETGSLGQTLSFAQR